MAGDGSPRPLHLSTNGSSLTERHDGSIRHLVAGNQRVELANMELTNDQVCAERHNILQSVMNFITVLPCVHKDLQVGSVNMKLNIEHDHS